MKKKKTLTDLAGQDVKMATQGLVIVYTGEGKGKTTAALGLALRATGYNKKVLIMQFGKVWFTGEKRAVEKLAPLVTFVQGGISFVGILDDVTPFSEHKKAFAEMYDYIYKEVMSDKWDVVVCDEIVGAVAGKLLTHAQIAALIKNKPERLDLVLTGHHASEKLIQIADLVTEMKEVKHPFQKGILAKPSIDY